MKGDTYKLSAWSVDEDVRLNERWHTWKSGDDDMFWEVGVESDREVDGLNGLLKVNLLHTWKYPRHHFVLTDLGDDKFLIVDEDNPSNQIEFDADGYLYEDGYIEQVLASVL